MAIKTKVKKRKTQLTLKDKLFPKLKRPLTTVEFNKLASEADPKKYFVSPIPDRLLSHFGGRMYYKDWMEKFVWEDDDD